MVGLAGPRGCNMGVWRVRRLGWGRVVVGLLTLGAMGWSSIGWGATAYAPTVHEFALLAYTNMSRAEHGLKPLVWNDALARAARWKSEDEIAHACGTHDSCGGESWTRRIGRYYPGWIALGENMAASGSEPRVTHDDWMASPTHRPNILSSSYTEFGAGMAIGDQAHGFNVNSTEDFGSRGLPVAIPVLPAAGVSPLREYSTTPRYLLVNYYDVGGAPRSVRALVGSKCVTLPRMSGNGTNGTYGTTLKFADGCTPVVFEALASDGSRHRWPAQGAIQVQAGSYNCSEDFTSSAPTQDCGGGGGPLPTPSPAPAPTPGAQDDELSALRVSLKSERDPREVKVQVEATLPALPSFDPASGPVAIALSVGESASWSKSLPHMCGATPCLKANRKKTVYTYKDGTKGNLSFTRKQNGRWKMRLLSRHQPMTGLAPGAVELSVTVSGHAVTGVADGELDGQGLTASGS